MIWPADYNIILFKLLYICIILFAIDLLLRLIISNNKTGQGEMEIYVKIIILKTYKENLKSLYKHAFITFALLYLIKFRFCKIT